MKTSENSGVIAFVQQLPYPKSAVFMIACLEDMQARFDWISQDAIAALATHLHVEAAKVVAVIDACPDAFSRTRLAHEALQVCNGPICRMHGADALCRQLNQQGFKPKVHACLGACDRAPAARCGHALVAPADLQAIIRASAQEA